MWKKFCVAVLSFILLSGIIVASQQLFAATISKVLVEQTESRDYYINEEIPFHVRSQSEVENVLFISGGHVIGNSDEYTIPLQENSADFILKDISKPGIYQGSIDAQVSYSNNASVSNITAPFSFVLYGKAFQQDSYSMQVNENVLFQTFGILPESLKNYTIQYHSSDESIARVDESGFVTALKKGTATIDVMVLDEFGTTLSTNSCSVEVAEEEKIEVDLEKAIPGEDYDYRFIEMETLYEDQTKDKVVGTIHLGQSGTHTYYVDKGNEETIRIEDGNIILITEEKANTYQAIVYARHEESKKVYKIPVSYTVNNKKEQEETNAFSFRYQGEDVKHIIHAYQSGANTFQISSNQAISDVYFQLKDEADNAYFSVSQTGNVSIKKVTKNPVIIKATWKKQVYELPVVIEKAEQVISQDVQHIVVRSQDGAFEPIIKGAQGTGKLVFVSGNTDVASILMSKDQQMSIQPNAVGKTSIEVYSNGDENYKKSNVLRFEIEVIEDESIPNGLQAQKDWLLYPQIDGEEQWYHEEVVLRMNPDIETISEFSYQGEWMEELTIAENGVQSIPITFRDTEEGIESNALMIQLAIDTHAPMITKISEASVTDNPLKELLNQATFQKAYGTGKKIAIETSDFLLDKQIKVSGVTSINYKIYAVEDHQEELLLEAKEDVRNDYIEVIVDDTRPHKVCANVTDKAGLVSEETCTIIDEEIPSIASENSGITLQGRAFQTNTKLYVEDVLSDVLADDVYLDEQVEIQAALKLTVDKENLKTQEETFDIVIPIRSQDDALHMGIWKQKQENGSYKDVTSSYDAGSCTITTDSLNTLIYVQEKNTKSDLQSLTLSNPNKQTNIAQNNIVNTAFRTSNFDVKDIDTNILLCVGGGMMAILFAIILIRANHEEHYD